MRSKTFWLAGAVAAASAMYAGETPRLRTAAAASPEFRQVEDSGTSGRIGGPVMGFLLDPGSQAPRPVFGLPGAATLGPRLPLTGPVRSMAAAPGQNYLLVAVGTERELRYVAADGVFAEIPVNGASSGVSRIEISPRGTAAAVLLEGGSVELITGLPGAPAVSARHDLSALEGSIEELDVSDDGGALLVRTAHGDSGSLVAFAAGGARFLPIAGTPSSAAFLAGSRDAVIADSASNQVLLVRDAGGASTLAGIADANDGVSEPSAVAVSLDNRRVFIASRSGGRLLSMNLDRSDPVALECACSPSGFYRMSGNAVFRLNEPSKGPLLVLDADSAQSRVVFVPPDAPALDRSMDGTRLPRTGPAR